MRIARPWDLELEYTREMMLPLAHAPRGWPASVLQVGLGAASITRYLHRHCPAAKVTVVEILPQVVAAARQFFKLPEESQRLRIVIGDGYEYLAATKRRFDFIVVDGFDEDARTGMLETLPFYLNCRERLTPKGVVAVNLLKRRGGIGPTVARLREAFEDGVVRPMCEEGNTIAFGAREGGSHLLSLIPRIAPGRSSR